MTGTCVEPGELGGPVAALAGDQRVAASSRADDERLQDAVLADRVGQLGECLLVEAAARVARPRRCGSASSGTSRSSGVGLKSVVLMTLLGVGAPGPWCGRAPGFPRPALLRARPVRSSRTASRASRACHAARRGEREPPQAV